MRLTGGAFANFEAEVIEDRGDLVRVAVDIFGRRTEVEVEREHTDLPPLPPLVLPPLASVLDAIEAWMREAAPDTFAAHGRTADEDLHALAALGDGACDLVELYRRFGGTTDWQGFFQGCELVPLRSGFGSREHMNRLEAEGTFYRWMPNEWWHPGWLPFLDNHSYDMYCVDLVGTMGGTAGQIVRWSKDSESRSILAPSLGAWLGAFVVGRESGHFIWDPHEGIRVAPGRETEEHRFLRRALPGHPVPTAARSRKEVEGAEPPPKPAQRVVANGIAYAVTRQFWAPGSTCVNALAYLRDRDLLAVGQYDWGEPPGGLSLVDPSSGEVVQVVLGKNEGSALELESVGSQLVVRRLRGSHNEIVVMRADGALQVVREGLPTRMEAFVGVGDEAVAIAGEKIEIVELASLRRDVLELDGTHCVVGLSPDGRVLVVGQRDQPLRWYDAQNGRQTGQTEASVYPKRIAFGIDGDLWVAANDESLRIDLASGRLRDHESARLPFVVALHRATQRIAFAGYGGMLVVLDAVSGKRIASDDAHRSRVYGLAWNETGTRLWSGDEGGQLVERTLG